MKYLFLLGSSLALTAPALAQADGVEQLPLPRDSWNTGITVVGSGLEDPVDEIGQSVSVVGREEIESIQGPDLTRVLERLPGVAIIRNGGLGSQTSVFVRGANSYQLLVLVDGVRVADPSTPQGGYDFGNLLAGNIDKVELLRGSNSVAWGSQAIGGVLAVTTRQMEGVEASAEYGAHDTVHTTASAGATLGAFSGTLAAGYAHSDGISALTAGSEADGFDQWHVTGKGLLELGSGLSILANGRYADSKVALDFTGVGDDLPSADDMQKTRDASGRIGMRYKSEALELNTGFSLSDTHRVYDNPVFGSFDYTGRSERAELDGRWTVTSQLALVFGAEHEWSRYDGTFDPKQTARQASAHALLDFRSGPVRLSGGVRIDDHDRFGSEWTLGANGSVELAGGWRLRASYGEGFRTPTLFELYGFAGNPSLKPETSKSYDIGVEKGDRSGPLHVALTAFRRDSRNLIEFQLPFGPYFNVGRARAQGIELEASVAVTEHVRVRGAYTYLETENRTAGDPFDGYELARRPRHSANLSADWRTPLHELTLGADMKIVGDSFDQADNLVKLGSYALVTLRASLPVTERIEFFGRIENLGDEHYETAAGYGTMGRSGYLGARARF